VEGAEAPLVVAARTLSRELLGHLPLRLRHSSAVAARSIELNDGFAADDSEALSAAAWLHDIGYAPTIRDTGFHPLDGARYLLAVGWLDRVCGLVAYHSGAIFVASAWDLVDELAEFECETGPVADVLTYADQTVGPRGQPMTIDHRIADMLRRHGPASPNARAHEQRGRYLREVADRVEARRPDVIRCP